MSSQQEVIYTDVQTGIAIIRVLEYNIAVKIGERSAVRSLIISGGCSYGSEI